MALSITDVSENTENISTTEPNDSVQLLDDDYEQSFDSLNFSKLLGLETSIQFSLGGSRSVSPSRFSFHLDESVQFVSEFENSISSLGPTCENDVTAQSESSINRTQYSFKNALNNERLKSKGHNGELFS